MTGWSLIGLTALVVLIWVGAIAALVWAFRDCEEDGY